MEGQLRGEASSASSHVWHFEHVNLEVVSCQCQLLGIEAGVAHAALTVPPELYSRLPSAMLIPGTSRERRGRQRHCGSAKHSRQAALAGQHGAQGALRMRDDGRGSWSRSLPSNGPPASI